MGRKWLQKLETFLIVTVITVLVWLYADVQNVKVFQDQHVRIELVPLDAQELAISPSLAREVTLTFRASNIQKQQFDLKNNQLRSDNRAIPIEVDAPPSGDTAERMMNIADLLRNSELSELGLDIISTEPAELPVRVEQMERMQLPVQVKWDGMNVAEEPRTDTKRANLAVPLSLADAARSSYLVADLSQVNAGNAPPGAPESRDVPLSLPEEVLAQADEFQKLNITYQPEAVTVTFKLESKQKSITLPSVKVLKSVLPTLDNQFQFTITSDQLFVPDVVLTGPSKEIDAIEADPSNIYADLRLTVEQLDNLDGDKLSLRPRIIGLPPQVYVTSTLPQIEVTVTPKQTNN